MIVNTPGVEALLLLPEWHGANYWPYFFNGGQQKPHVVSDDGSTLPECMGAVPASCGVAHSYGAETG